jgi:hypothetical protein
MPSYDYKYKKYKLKYLKLKKMIDNPYEYDLLENL